MIAVTCRNGEHFSVDPQTIARVETDPDTVIHLADGVAELAESATRVRQSTMFVERRQYSRDGDESHGSAADRAVPPDDAEV